MSKKLRVFLCLLALAATALVATLYGESRYASKLTSGLYGEQDAVYSAMASVNEQGLDKQRITDTLTKLGYRNVFEDQIGSVVTLRFRKPAPSTFFQGAEYVAVVYVLDENSAVNHVSLEMRFLTL